MRNQGPGHGPADASFRLLLLWGLFILYGTTIPFDFSTSPAEASGKLQAALATPWRGASRKDVVGNVLLLRPGASPVPPGGRPAGTDS